MPTRTSHTAVEPGDIVRITRHHIGDSRRSGEILELLGGPGHERYRVRWDDGHESIFTPGSDAVIEHEKRRPRS